MVTDRMCYTSAVLSPLRVKTHFEYFYFVYFSVIYINLWNIWIFIYLLDSFTITNINLDGQLLPFFTINFF